jgi:hypothetical protein
MDDSFKGVKDLDEAFSNGVDEFFFEGLVDFNSGLNGSRDRISEGADKGVGSSKGWI